VTTAVVPELAEILRDRQRHLQGQDPDPDAGARARGLQAVAEFRDRGLDLGQPDDHELVELGRSALEMDLALLLEGMKEQNLATRRMLEAQAQAKGHDPDPDQGEVEGGSSEAYRTPVRSKQQPHSSDPDQGRDKVGQAGPEAEHPFPPKMREPVEHDGQDQGHTDHVSRVVPQNGARNVSNVPDDDHDWRGF
jgi:hypothetical protein